MILLTLILQSNASSIRHYDRYLRVQSKWKYLSNALVGISCLMLSLISCFHEMHDDYIFQLFFQILAIASFANDCLFRPHMWSTVFDIGTQYILYAYIFWQYWIPALVAVACIYVGYRVKNHFNFISNEEYFFQDAIQIVWHMYVIILVKFACQFK